MTPVLKQRILGYVAIIICLLSLSDSHLSAKEYAPYKIKTQFIGGYIYPHDPDIISPLVKGPALGGEIAFEFVTDGTKSWHIEYNYPELGFALQVIDFHNPEIMGQMISVYPYINLPLAKNNSIAFNVKIGGGVGFCTAPTDLKAAIADPRSIKEKAGDYNFATGSVFNFALSAGLNVEFKVHKNFSICADMMYNHYSNASLAQPNAGLNLLNGYLGLKYMPIYKESPKALDSIASNPTKRWSGEIILSAGGKKLYYKDTHFFACASLNIGGYYQTCNKHRVGVGVDLFYDGAYIPTYSFDEISNSYVKDNTYTKYGRTFTNTNEFKNKIRCGINIANDLIIGKFMVGFQVGIYLYDPIKNMEPSLEAKEAAENGTSISKGIFYAYDIQSADGWNYFRITAKYKITEHLLANVSFKTHLQKVEFAEFGLGYSF